MEVEEITIREKVKDYIQQATFIDKDKIRDDSLIFKEGYFDSMGFVLLITFLEENFNIKTNVAKFSIWKRMVAMTANGIGLCVRWRFRSRNF